MVWVIAFGELFFGDLWCVVWGYGGMRTHFWGCGRFLGQFQSHATLTFRYSAMLKPSRLILIR